MCENLTRSLILGVDFAKQRAAGVHWTKHNSFVLTIDGETVAETKELHNKAAVSLKKRTKLPPGSCAVVDVDINSTSTDKVQLVPDEYCIASNPNMYMYNLFADLSEKTKDSVTPFVIVNLSNDQYLEFPENHVVAFTEKDDTEGEVFEIEQVDITPRNWIPAQDKLIDHMKKIHLGTTVHTREAMIEDEQAQAHAVCQWFREMQRRERRKKKKHRDDDDDDDKDDDETYHPSQDYNDDSQIDPKFRPTRRELREADEEGDS